MYLSDSPQRTALSLEHFNCYSVQCCKYLDTMTQFLCSRNNSKYKISVSGIFSHKQNVFLRIFKVKVVCYE